jgi:hypothetical protein
MVPRMSDALPPSDAPLEALAVRRLTAAEQAWTVLRHEFRDLFLSARTLGPMVVYAGFGALAMSLFLKASAALRDKARETGLTDEQLREGVEQTLGEVLSFVGWGDVGTGAEIVRDHVPLAELSFFAAASYFLPLLVALVSFDQFSNLSTRGARFALLRVRRWSYFVGKALAAVASVAGFLAVMWAVVVVATVRDGGSGEAWYAVREGVRGWGLMCVLALPYLALTALVSSLARPGLAFVGTFGAYIGISITNAMAHHWLPEPVSKVVLVAFPWEHAHKLIARDWPTLGAGVVGLVAIALALYGVTGAMLEKRDV